MKNDVPGTLAKVAAAGYKEVEFAGYPELYAPNDLRALLDSNGLSAPSSHIPYDVVLHRMPQAVEAAHILGQKFIVCPWIDDAQRNAPDGYKRAADDFNGAARSAGPGESSSGTTITSGDFCRTRVSAGSCPTISCSNPRIPPT